MRFIGATRLWFGTLFINFRKKTKGLCQVDLIFGKWFDRTKPGKLGVFPESELRDCEDYFLEIQSESTLPPNEIIIASERLALIRSQIDLRHSDAKHRQTQRLARWAIAFGMLSVAVAIASVFVQFLAHKPTHETLLATGEPIVATPSARELLTPIQELDGAATEHQ